jgi:hypothetical protein
MTEQELYEMKIGDLVEDGSWEREIHRVCGGWNYIYFARNGDDACSVAAVFVPEPQPRTIQVFKNSPEDNIFLK